MKQTIESIDFTRVNNDVNGNPRYVCHFLAFITDADRKIADDAVKQHFNTTGKPFAIEILYQMALKKAKKIGGKKFHNKQYGGGIVFQSYNIADTEKSIHELVSSL